MISTFIILFLPHLREFPPSKELLATWKELPAQANKKS